jgi:repressor LexA
MALKALTERQSKVLKFIERSMASSGYPPTLREIGNAFGIKSTNGVNDHLRALMKKGYLAREAGKSRTLKVLMPKTKTNSSTLGQSIPIFASLSEMRKVAPTAPLFAIANTEQREFSVFKNLGNGVEAILTKFHFEI